MPELGQSVKRFLSEPGLGEEEKARRTVECLKYLRAYFEGLVSGLIGVGLEAFLVDETHREQVHRDIRSVFLDLGGTPRFVTRWLGLVGQRPTTPPPLTALWALGEDTLLEEVVSYNALLQEWLRSARAFEENWAVEPDRVRHRDSSTVYPLDPPLDAEQLGPLHPAVPGSSPDLSQAINQVKTLFEPLTEPYFDLLGIPELSGSTGEFEAKLSRPIAPTELLERPPARTPGRRVPIEPAFPPHLKILACRLSDALERQDPVASANATVEAIDYMVRFFAGVAGGGLAELEGRQERTPVDLEFDECLDLLRNSVQALRVYRGDVIADSILAVFEPGGSQPDHHSWLGLGERSAEEDPAVWRVRADSRIQDEDPGPCAQLLKGILPILSDWLEASKYFFNCWDLYHSLRRDFNLDVRLARGDRAFNAFPLVYPERYGIVLPQPDLNKARENPLWEPRGFGQGTSVANLTTPEPSDADPPHLARLLEEFGRAVRDEEPLPAGNALLGCFDFLLRYYASLATGALRSIAPFPLESVLAESASLLHCSKLLHYSLFALDRFPEHPVSGMVGSVFFQGERPRAFTRWLGFAGSPLSGLENLSGWTHMLRRPDAALRIDEILGQIRVYTQFLGEWVEQSRHVFKALKHHYDVGEGSNTVGVVFECDGSRFRGVPDIYVGEYEFHLSREEVLAWGSAETLPNPMSEQSFEAWEAALNEELPTSVFEDDPELTELVPELADFESGPIVMPSLFPDEPAPPTWGQPEADGFSRYCQALNYSGPESRPKIFSERVAAFVAKRDSGLILVEGGPGFGKTFLSRTLTNPRSSPFDTNFPVIHYSVGRRIEGDYGILIEVLNEHLGQQTELAEAGFSKLDPRVIRDLNVRYPEGQAASRFLAYLSALTIANNHRRFLLVLDGLDEHQAAAEAGLTVLDFLPSRLPEGVFLMLTYRPSFRAKLEQRLETGHEHCLQINLDSEDPTYQGLLYQHMEKIEWKVADLNTLIKKAGGGLALSKLLRDGVACEFYGAPAELPSSDRIFESFLEALHSRFPQDDRFEAGVRFLMLLAASQRPLSVPMLIDLHCDPVAVRKITELFPSAFAFWGEDEPVVGLAHDWLATRLREGRPEQFREACLELLGRFESEPDRGWLSLAFWWAIEGGDPKRLEAFAENEQLKEFRQKRLAELDSSRQYHEKVVLLDGWCALLHNLVDAHQAAHWREELGWAHSSRGLAYLHLGQFQRCLRDVERAIEIFTGLFEKEGQVELTNGLAAAYNRRSEALLLLGQTGPALENAEMAINYYKDAVVSLERNDLMRLLALAYLNRGEVRRARGELSEARDDISEAIDIYESLGELGEHDRTEQAHAYRSRGVVGLSLGEYELAQDDSTRALEILTGLAEAHHHQEFRNELAAAYNNRAAALHRQGEFELALEDYDQAVALRQQLVDEGRLDLRTDLAITHTNRGLVRTGVGEIELALEDYEMAISIRTQLVSAEGRLDLRGQLAFTRVCRGSTYRALGQRQQAVDDYRRATEEYNLAAADESVGPDTWADMALAFGSLGALYLDVGEPEHCLACCDRALELYDRIPEVEADPVYRFEMAVAHNNRGEACKALGDIEKAEACYREATRRYQLLVESEGRHDLAGELAGAYQNHAQALVMLGQGEAALERVEHAISLYEQQTDSVHRLAAALLIRAGGRGQAGDHPAAFDDLARAVEIYSELVVGQGRLDFHDELAQTYQQRASLHFELGAIDEALADIERAVTHFQHAWEFTRDEQWRRELVRALLQRANYHRASGDHESAGSDILAAFGFGGRTTLPADFELGPMLGALAVEAESLANSGHLERSKQKWDAVIKLCRTLAGPHLPAAEAHLAAAHFRRGWVLHRQGKATTADLDLGRAVDTYSVLVSLGGRKDLLGDLAGAYLARGRHLASMGRVGRALPQFGYALEIFSELRGSDPQWGRALALTLLERADLEVARRDPARAVVDLTRAGEVLDGLTDSSPESLGQARALCQLQLATAIEALGREREAYRAYLKAAYKFSDLMGSEPGPNPHRAGCVEAMGRAAQLAPPAEAGHHWLNVLAQVTAGLANGQDLTSLVALDGLNDYLQKLSESDPRVVVSIVDVLTQFPTAGGPHPAWRLFAPTISKVVLDPNHDETLVERLVGSVGQAVAALPRANSELPWLKETLELLALHPHQPGESLRLAIRGLGEGLMGLPVEVRERFDLSEDLIDSLRAR